MATFWKDGSTEPKRNYRFRATLFGQVAWYTKSFDAPKFDLEAKEVHFSDHVFKYPGKLKWQDVSITLMDPGGADDVVEKTLSLISDAGYAIPSTGDTNSDYDTFSKAELLLTSTTNVTLEVLDASGIALETWTLHNAFIKSAEFGSFDYSNEDMREIKIALVYDWASCQLNTDGSEGADVTYFDT